MNKTLIFLIILVLFFQCKNDVNAAHGSLNLDFELNVHSTLLPRMWHISGENVDIYLDSREKHSGRFSLKMEVPSQSNANGRLTGRLPIETFAGKTVELKGWIKTQNVQNGYAGLWFRVDGSCGNVLGFENMDDRGLSGNNDWTQVSIKMDINKDAKNIRFGGILTGEGIAWFDNFELYINDEKYIDPIVSKKKHLSRREISELRNYIHPLRTYEPDGGDTSDLDILNKLIGNSRVVALGEVSHGSSEIFKMKNRIIQYLAENKDFDVFSIEAGMPEAYRVNDYVIHGKGNPTQLIWGMQYWMWATEEVLDMVRWMRRFNQPTRRIKFTGFDMQVYDGAINELLNAFKGSENVEKEINDLKRILDATSAWIQREDIRENVFERINSILSFLEHSIETSSFQISKKAWLKQNIVIIQQNLGIHDASFFNYMGRDQAMANNFMWIKEQNPNSKFVIWAHNIHIMKADQLMGHRLAQKLGDDYVSFGFTFFDGSFTAWGSHGLTAYEAAPAYRGTLEYLLNQVNEPIFILDLKKIRASNSQYTEWLRQQLDYRIAGSIGGDRISNEFMNRKVVNDFDYLVFIRTSTPSVLLPR